jgi:hypothetical protein
MGALLVLWLRPVPAEMALFFTGPNTAALILGRLKSHQNRKMEHLDAYKKAVQRDDKKSPRDSRLRWPKDAAKEKPRREKNEAYSTAALQGFRHDSLQKII